MEKEKFENAKHITIVVEEKNLALGSALYSYILTLHKKVSFVTNTQRKIKYSFLPWYDKIRENIPSSSDFAYEMAFSTVELYDFFVKNNIKINKKMATALYAALLQEYKCFQSLKCDGIIFAVASTLIEHGAEYQICREYLCSRVALSIIRLKGILFSTMVLKNNAKHAELFISQEKLQAAGACVEDCFEIMDEALLVAHVEKVTLYESGTNKILKEI